ncbi:MAG: MerR family transcriptional regulator [Anaerolineae bacterium]|nr:MerR family transcriptional regulator [Anaerolineae bacterium]
MYTVKEVAELAGISIRTLHYYDEIDLLKPSQVAENGYRYYDEAALLRLQQVLLYREIGMPLAKIREILNQPDFDLLTALREHRTRLIEKVEDYQQIIVTLDQTILHVTGEETMSDKKIFGWVSEEEQKEYEREVRLSYDQSVVQESAKRWGSYNDAQKQAIFDEGNKIYQEFIVAMDAGANPRDDVIQRLLVRWHNHLHCFYEPTLDILRGLGMLYNTDERFIANFRKLHPDLPQFLEDSIEFYVDELETAEIERMLAEEEQGRAQK